MKNIGFSFIILSLVLLINGCAQHSVHSEFDPEQDQKRLQRSAKIHTQLAGEYYHRRQFSIAIEEVDEALQADTNYAPAYNVLGLIYMALHEDDTAQKHFERALSLSENDSDINNSYGWFMCQRAPEQMDQAINHFMTAVKNRLYLTPERSYANAGVCEIKRSDYDAAAEYFKRALVYRPDYSPALIGLIEIDFKKGNTKIARTKLFNHLQRAESTPEGLWLAMQIERKMGDRYAADSYQFQLQKNFPNSKEATALREYRFK